MSDRVDRIVIGLMVVFTLVGLAAFALSDDGLGRWQPTEITPPPPPVSANVVDWFERVRPHCNAVEVDSHSRSDPAPEGDDALPYVATCYALAGRIEYARSKLLELPEGERWRGAGVLFEAVHPAADAGDELAAGPIMELVVEFWPNHYMALYHAGAAAYQRGEAEPAKEYLARFLEAYDIEDGWTVSARSMIAELG